LKKRVVLVLPVFFVFLFTARPAWAASLSLSPASVTKNVGEVFTVDIVLDTAGEAVSGATAILNYDTAKLQVQDDDSAATGVNIKSGPTLSQVLTNTVDTTAGKIRYDAGNLGSTFTGRGVLATIRLKPVAAGTAQVSFVFDPNSTTDTSAVAAASGPTSLLDTVNDGNYTIDVAGTASSESLPQTGIVEESLKLLSGGLLLVLAAVFLVRKAYF